MSNSRVRELVDVLSSDNEDVAKQLYCDAFGAEKIADLTPVTFDFIKVMMCFNTAEARKYFVEKHLSTLPWEKAQHRLISLDRLGAELKNLYSTNENDQATIEFLLNLAHPARLLRYQIEEMLQIYIGLHDKIQLHRNFIDEICSVAEQHVPLTKIAFDDSINLKFSSIVDHLEILFLEEYKAWQKKHPKANFRMWMNKHHEKCHSLRMVSGILDALYSNEPTHTILTSYNSTVPEGQKLMKPAAIVEDVNAQMYSNLTVAKIPKVITRNGYELGDFMRSMKNKIDRIRACDGISRAKFSEKIQDVHQLIYVVDGLYDDAAIDVGEVLREKRYREFMVKIGFYTTIAPVTAKTSQWNAFLESLPSDELRYFADQQMEIETKRMTSHSSVGLQRMTSPYAFQMADTPSLPFPKNLVDFNNKITNSDDFVKLRQDHAEETIYETMSPDLLEVITPAPADLFKMVKTFPTSEQQINFLRCYFLRISWQARSRMICNLAKLSSAEKQAYHLDERTYACMENLVHPSILVGFRVFEIEKIYFDLHGNYALENRQNFLNSTCKSLLKINVKIQDIFSNEMAPAALLNSLNLRLLNQAATLVEEFGGAWDQYGARNIEHSADYALVKKLNTHTTIDHSLRLFGVMLGDFYRQNGDLLVKLGFKLKYAHVVIGIDDIYADRFQFMRKVLNMADLESYLRSSPDSHVSALHSVGDKNLREIIKTTSDLVRLINIMLQPQPDITNLFLETELQMFLAEMLGIPFLEKLTRIEQDRNTLFAALPNAAMRAHFSQQFSLFKAEKNVTAVGAVLSGMLGMFSTRPAKSIPVVQNSVELPSVSR